MTIQFPDISEYTPVSVAGAPVVLARATIGTVTDTHWQSNVNDAATHGVPLLAYCFLNAGSLGPSPEQQADYAYSVVGDRPTMLDWEPNRGACATLGEACRWIDRFRYRGGNTRLTYLPKWAWSGTLGSPGLQALADRQMVLVASNYTAYSDNGPGWQPYYTGCPVPIVQWQFADNWPFNGAAVDWNAYKGTVSDYLTTTGGNPVGSLEREINADSNAWAVRMGVDSPVYPNGQPGNTVTPGNPLWDLLRQVAADAHTAAGAVTQPVTITQDQVNTAVLQALSSPTVLQTLGAAIASHIHVT